jgi:hypothetical protein
MESATILVLVLCAGVVGLLVWFELNSRRNEANKKQGSADVETLTREGPTKVESDTQKKKTA